MNGEGSNTWMVFFLRQPIDFKLSLLARQHTTNGTATAPHVYGDHPAHTHTHTLIPSSRFPRFCYLKHRYNTAWNSTSSIRKPSRRSYDVVQVADIPLTLEAALTLEVCCVKKSQLRPLCSVSKDLIPQS